jgi:hypothetical protein
MCLITTQSEALVSEEDIKCYKLVIPCGVGYRTPYRNTFISYEKGKGKELIVPSGDEEISEHYDFFCRKKYYIVKGGFIHCYQSLEEAKWRAITYGYAVLECIISAGTRYYSGVYCDICAKAIKVVERIF